MPLAYSECLAPYVTCILAQGNRPPLDYFRYTRYGLERLATDAGLDVQSIRPTCGLWATLGQRAVDVIYSRYGAGKPLLVRGIVLMFCAIWLTLALVADRWGEHQGDTLDNILIAAKPVFQTGAEHDT